MAEMSFREWVDAIDRGDAAVTLEMRRLWQQGLLNPAQEQIATDMALEGKIPPRDAPIDESEMTPAQPGPTISDEERARMANALREDPYGHLESHDYGGTVQLEGLPPSRIRGDITAGAEVWAGPGQREWELKNAGVKPEDFPPDIEPPRGVSIKPPADTELRRFGNEKSGMTATGQFEREFGEPVKPLSGMEAPFEEGPGTTRKDIWSMTPEERLAYRMQRVKALTSKGKGAT